MTATLTDRYVYAVTRSLPQAQRADIDQELRASIADAVDARVEGGEQPDAAEKATLTDLGNPSRLAGEYAGRPAWLIGPESYYSWSGLLKILAATVLPVVFAVLFVINLIEGGIGQAFGASIGVTLTVAVHLAFWITLVFAIVERSNDAKAKASLETGSGWTIDTLPQVPVRGVGSTSTRLGEFIPNVVFLLFFAGAIVWQYFNSVFQDVEGRPIPLLADGLWDFWLPYTFAILGLELIFAIAMFAVGRWNWVLAAIHVPLTLAFAIPAVWLLLTHQVWNVDFFAQFGWEATVTNLVDPISAGVIALVAVWDIVEGFRKAYLSSRKK